MDLHVFSFSCSYSFKLVVFSWSRLPVVEIPGAEDDPVLLAAVGVNGVEGRARVLIEGALTVKQKSVGEVVETGVMIQTASSLQEHFLSYLAGEPSFPSTQAILFIVGPIKVAAVVLCFLEHLLQALRGFQELRPDFSLLDAFGGFQQLSPEENVCLKKDGLMS